MTLPIVTFNLDKMWGSVLNAPNVKENPKNVKLGNIMYEAFQQQKVKSTVGFTDEEIVLKNVVHQLSSTKQKCERLACFANRLVNMAQFQRWINYKERLALRNACDILGGKRQAFLRSICNTIYELGISLKRSWERPFLLPVRTVPQEYNPMFERGLKKLLMHSRDLTDLSEKQLRQNLALWFPPFRRPRSVAGVLPRSVFEKVNKKLDVVRERLVKIILRTPDKTKIPDKIGDVAKEIESQQK